MLIARRFRVSLLWLLLLLMTGPWTGVAAQENADNGWIDAAGERLKLLDAALETWRGTPPDDKSMAEVQDEVLAIRDRAEKCVAEYGAQLAGIQERLGALGEPAENAAREIVDSRERFQREQQKIESHLAACRLLSIGARDMKDAIVLQRREILSKQLLHRDRNIWQTVSHILVNGFPTGPSQYISFSTWPAIGAGLLLLLLLVPLALATRSYLREHYPAPQPEEVTAPMRRTMLAAMYSRRAPWLAALFSALVTLYVGGAAPLAAVGVALLLSAAVAPLVQLFVCQGRLKCAEGVPARLLIDLLLVAGALVLMNAGQYVPEGAYLVLRALFLLALALVSLWLLQRLVRRDDLETIRSLRMPIAIALLAGPIADWLGYLNLGHFLTYGVYGSAAGMLLVWLVISPVGRLFESLRDSDNEVQSPARQWLGYGRGEKVPGIGILHWLLRIAAVLAVGYWLLHAWQVSESDTAAVRDVIREGFDVGAIKIVPVKIVMAVLAFVVLLTLARWLRRQLGERWLTRTSLDSGARQSVVSLTSYTIVGLGIMLSLSMAGLDFQNLAIVAGALSVGIGFGLQNIVNNFVSGLILLFERPVRPGDWVIVGGTEGYVRKISIRYTLIQTFDRADVLVPNSELISNQVTNLMLSDTFGRVTIPVGVAYGTDTRQVRDILHKVAREHPMAVLHDPRVTAPRVFFMGFGDSSLDFELRFFIQNIDYKLSVRSDILFAIDDAFREARIEIPFPQRVVHMQPGADTLHTEEKPTKTESGESPQ